MTMPNPYRPQPLQEAPSNYVTSGVLGQVVEGTADISAGSKEVLAELWDLAEAGINTVSAVDAFLALVQQVDQRAAMEAEELRKARDLLNLSRDQVKVLEQALDRRLREMRALVAVVDRWHDMAERARPGQGRDLATILAREIAAFDIGVCVRSDDGGVS